MKLVERVRLAVGDLDRRRCLVVPQSPLIGKREVILQEMPKAALITAADVVLRHVMATQFHSQGDACPATIKTDPRRQLELTPDRVVLRGGLGALRHVV